MANMNTNGLRDWIVQRISSILIGIYAVVNLFYILLHRPLYFAEWSGVYHHLSVKIFTLIVLLSVLLHAWIGLWTVFTDYIKILPVRFVLEIIVVLLLVGYVGWGLEALWR